MDILMKMKCSPALAHTPHTMKMVDRLQKQQQQKQPTQTKATTTPQTNNLPTQQHPCMEYLPPTGGPAMDCCSPMSYVSMAARCCSAGNYCSTPLPACCAAGGGGGAPGYAYPTYISNMSSQQQQKVVQDESMEEGSYKYEEPEENFVSIDDAKIKGFLMKIGQEQREKEVALAAAEAQKQLVAQEQQKFQQQQQKQVQQEIQTKTEETSVLYEIIDLDDEEEREKLKRIKQQAEYEEHKRQRSPVEKIAKEKQENGVAENLNQEIGTEKSATTRHSPDIRLVPASRKHKNASTHAQQRQSKTARKHARSNGPLRIIAEIDLLDSSEDEQERTAYDDEENDEEPTQEEGNQILQVMSDDEGNDALVPAVVNEPLFNDMDEEVEEEFVDDEDLPLAAAAVSCELDCDDNDEFDQQDFLKAPQLAKKFTKKQKTGTTIVVNSDDDNEFVDENEDGLEVRWEELALSQRGSRNNFECLICGKKVQSNYNLRRHMMIHTGERPFGCDLCDRRFREFSDLKKHRRRHGGEPNFICMICRVNPPLETDPTRCNNCDSKLGAMVALRHAQARSPNSSVRKTALEQPQKPQLSQKSVATTTTTTTSTTTANLKPLLTMNNKTTKDLPPVSINKETQAKDLPPLIPINTSFEDQLRLLDTIPAVHRSVYINGTNKVRRKEFPCPLCQRPFGTRHNLKRHFMIHTGEKPFSCTRCRKPFREYSTLKKHMITHAKERWYKCLRCPQKFLDYLEYTAHKHCHTNEPSGSGNEDISASSSCQSPQSSPKKRPPQKSFKIDESFESQDEDSETVDDWLECCECGERFTDIDTYTDHLKTHDMQVLYYECYMCKDNFSELPAFERHMKDVHGAIMDSDDDSEDLILDEAKNDSNN